jgi:hypothetical protein
MFLGWVYWLTRVENSGQTGPFAYFGLPQTHIASDCWTDLQTLDGVTARNTCVSARIQVAMVVQCSKSEVARLTKKVNMNWLVGPPPTTTKG